MFQLTLYGIKIKKGYIYIDKDDISSIGFQGFMRSFLQSEHCRNEQIIILYELRCLEDRDSNIC